MSDTAVLQDELFRERVRRAQQVPLGERVFACATLFDEVCQRMKDGIRAQFPEADDAAVQQMMRRRLARLRQVEEHGLFHPVTQGE